MSATFEHFNFPTKYTEQQKKRENLSLFNCLEIKYVEYNKYMLHVKLTVY